MPLDVVFVVGLVGVVARKFVQFLLIQLARRFSQARIGLIDYLRCPATHPCCTCGELVGSRTTQHDALQLCMSLASLEFTLGARRRALKHCEYAGGRIRMLMALGSIVASGGRAMVFVFLKASFARAMRRWQVERARRHCTSFRPKSPRTMRWSSLSTSHAARESAPASWAGLHVF